MNIGDKEEQSAVWSSIAPKPEKRSLAEYVYEQLQQLIVNGDLSWGARLVESQVASRMGISRTPVREALHKLEMEGFISKSAGSGYAITGLEREDVLEIFGIRSVLESYAARLAAQRRRQDEIAVLEKTIAAYQDRLEKGLFHELPDINTQLHDLFYSMSHSPRLIKMINELKNQIQRFRRFLLHSEHRAALSNQDHRQILECIKNSEADRVEKVMQEHILRGQNLVLQELDQE